MHRFSELGPSKNPEAADSAVRKNIQADTVDRPQILQLVFLKKMLLIHGKFLRRE